MSLAYFHLKFLVTLTLNIKSLLAADLKQMLATTIDVSKTVK